MIERYTLPEMGRVWSEAHKYELWCRVEVLVLEAHARAGTVPAESVEPVRSAPPPTPEAVAAVEAVTDHDVIAFLTAWADNTTPRSAAAYVHYGMTSSDLLDTALAIQLTEATDLLVAKATRLVAALRDHALEHAGTLRPGRTHGIHAEPDSWGHRVADFAFAMARCRSCSIRPSLRWPGCRTRLAEPRRRARPGIAPGHGSSTARSTQSIGWSSRRHAGRSARRSCSPCRGLSRGGARWPAPPSLRRGDPRPDRGAAGPGPGNPCSRRALRRQASTAGPQRRSEAIPLSIRRGAHRGKTSRKMTITPNALGVRELAQSVRPRPRPCPEKSQVSLKGDSKGAGSPAHHARGPSRPWFSLQSKDSDS